MTIQHAEFCDNLKYVHYVADILTLGDESLSMSSWFT